MPQRFHFSQPFHLLLGLLLFWGASLHAADLYVDNVKGDDRRDGLSADVHSAASGPLATIDSAIKKALAGDTIHLAATGVDYRQQATFKDKGGEPGKPITLDGHGATLNGSDPCPVDGWEKLPSGVWVRPRTTSRNILVVDSSIVLEKSMVPLLQPGQFCFEFGQFNSPTVSFNPPQDRSLRECKVEVITESGETVPLDPAQWKGGGPFRYPFKGKSPPRRILLDGVEAPLLAAKDHLQPGEWCNAKGDLYFFPPTGKSPADLQIALSTRECGVAVGGSLAHLVIRNLNVHYVWNDAYNIHGTVTDTAFYNCNAADCFDEGFSAHDACETVLDGATYVRCDNGVMNVNKSGYSVTRNLIVRHSRHKGYGVAVINNQVRHELHNAVLIDNPTPISGRYVTADNVLILQTSAEKPPADMELVAPFLLRKASVIAQNLSMALSSGTGDIRLENCVLSSVEDGRQILQISVGQKIILDSIWLRPNTALIAVKGRESADKSLIEWLDHLKEAGDARLINLLAATGVTASEIRKGGILPPGAGCDPSLWAAWPQQDLP